MAEGNHEIAALNQRLRGLWPNAGASVPVSYFASARFCWGRNGDSGLWELGVWFPTRPPLYLPGKWVELAGCSLDVQTQCLRRLRKLERAVLKAAAKLEQDTKARDRALHAFLHLDFRRARE